MVCSSHLIFGGWSCLWRWHRCWKDWYAYCRPLDHTRLHYCTTPLHSASRFSPSPSSHLCTVRSCISLTLSRRLALAGSLTHPLAPSLTAHFSHSALIDIKTGETGHPTPGLNADGASPLVFALYRQAIAAPVLAVWSHCTETTTTHPQFTRAEIRRNGPLLLLAGNVLRTTAPPHTHTSRWNRAECLDPLVRSFARRRCVVPIEVTSPRQTRPEWFGGGDV